MIAKLPQTPEEMLAMLFSLMVQKAYEQVTARGRRGPLTENAIALIERQLLDDLRGDLGFAHEFKTFEVEPVIARARADLAAFFSAVRNVRRQELSE